MNIFIGFWKGASRKREVETIGKKKEEGARALRR